MYRLTLVKAWNTDEIRNYAELVARGRPDFIEVKVWSYYFMIPVLPEIFNSNVKNNFGIHRDKLDMYLFSHDSCHNCRSHYCLKGVTYCGDSKASNLTMRNVPWHEEVVSFVQQLADLLPEYEIASEHDHSNCILIAHKKVGCLQIPYFF